MSKPDSENSRKDQARRSILKSVVAGGAITAAKMTPEAWVKPVIDAVVLPGHAATTDGGGDGSGGTTMAPMTTPMPVMTGNFVSADLGGLLSGPLENSMEEEMLSEELLEFFLPAAHANSEPNCGANATCNLYISGNFSTTNADLCTSTGSGDSISVSGSSLVGSVYIDPFFITGGQFSVAQGCWNLTTNTSTIIALSPGGSGCSHGG